jgi:hypothetical protein
VKPEGARPERSPSPAPDDTAPHPAEAGLWEQFMARGNLAEALRRVEQNAGAPGIDGMSTKELRPWLKDHWPEIRSALDAGTYRPQAVRRVTIPKPSGGLRKLGVPAAVDRLICQALSQALTPIFDPQFHPHSFGYRPGRSQHHAEIRLDVSARRKDRVLVRPGGFRDLGGRRATRGSRPRRAMIGRGRAGAPQTVRAIARARRASVRARP